MSLNTGPTPGQLSQAEQRAMDGLRLAARIDGLRNRAIPPNCWRTSFCDREAGHGGYCRPVFGRLDK